MTENRKDMKITAEIRNWEFDNCGDVRGKIYDDTRMLAHMDGDCIYVLAKSKAKYEIEGTRAHWIVKSTMGNIFILYLDQEKKRE